MKVGKASPNKTKRKTETGGTQKKTFSESDALEIEGDLVKGNEGEGCIFYERFCFLFVSFLQKKMGKKQKKIVLIRSATITIAYVFDSNTTSAIGILS